MNGNRASEPFDEVAFTRDPEAPLSGSNAANTWWNPRDADKGLLARALLYMAVRYEAGDFVNLELSETAGASRMAKLSSLLAWHREFPPTEAERKRNHTIYTTYQFNRNPFIDNPLFVDQVFSNDTPGGAWKRARFTAAQLTSTAVSGDAADPDGDGCPNRLEYLFNTNPLLAETSGEAATTVAWLPSAGGRDGAPGAEPPPAALRDRSGGDLRGFGGLRHVGGLQPGDDRDRVCGRIDGPGDGRDAFHGGAAVSASPGGAALNRKRRRGRLSR